MWIFGAYGNSNVYLKDLSAITGNIMDTLAVKEVIIMKKGNKKEENQTPWHKRLQGINFCMLNAKILIFNDANILYNATKPVKQK